jgi:transposase
MISKDIEAKILRLYHSEAWPVGTIAAQLRVHADVVRRVLSAKLAPRPRPVRPTMLEPYLPFIEETLRRWPTVCARRLFDMCVDRGYRGSPDHFRHRIRLLRPKKAAEAYLRLKSFAGEQAQVDWGHFGRIPVGRARRQLVAFVMVLSHSRMIFLRFFRDARLASFLAGHVEAFQFFQGCPRVILYDNLKSAVLERVGDAIRFHPQLIELATHYRFDARPVAIRRGNEKGRVERAIRFVRDSFFAARRWGNIEDLNAQAIEWCRGRSADRRWVEDRKRTVREVFAEEQGKLQALAPNPFPCQTIEEVKIGKTPYARFDSNDYSVPHDKVRRTLAVAASETTVRILDGTAVICEHRRSWDKGACVEDPAHVAALVEAKRRARKERAGDRLVRSAPSVEPLLVELGCRGENLGSVTVRFMRLLDAYGAERLDRAAKEAGERGAPHPHSVSLILERERMEEGREHRVAVDLPDDPRVRNLAVRPHSLESYEALTKKEDADE